jgi:hypothetical protein
METKINMEVDETSNNKIDNIRFKKMLFVYNALEEGWTIKKNDESFIFYKNHEGKKEIFSESYLARFIKSNFDLNKILS